MIGWLYLLDSTKILILRHRSMHNSSIFNLTIFVQRSRIRLSFIINVNYSFRERNANKMTHDGKHMYTHFQDWLQCHLYFVTQRLATFFPQNVYMLNINIVYKHVEFVCCECLAVWQMRISDTDSCISHTFHPTCSARGSGNSANKGYFYGCK